MATRSVRPKCATCGTAVRAKDRFCASCGTPIAAAQAAAPQTPANAAPEPSPAPPPAPGPTSASLQVGTQSASRLREQRKVVTVLFADLSGSTPLAEKLDVEELRRILGSYFNVLALQIQRYEGTIDKYIGDAVMAVFGAPLSHEDDAERAMHAGLAMQSSIQRLNDDLERRYGVRLALRIGINTGEVVAGMLAGDVQSAYTVVGDAVNTAQRLESAAPLGQVLVSGSTRRLAPHAFEYEELPPLTLKGKAEPVIAYRVVRAREQEIDPEASPLAGRAQELELLLAASSEARTGRGRIVHLVGEAGVGKSRLLAEFKRALPPEFERMSARCASYETNTPYALVADLIRGAFGISDGTTEQDARAAVTAGLERYGAAPEEGTIALVLAVLGYADDGTSDPEMRRRLLVTLLRGLLRRAGERAPFVLAAEDLHWIDSASASIIAALVGDVPALPCLFVSTSRPAWRTPWVTETVPVEALVDTAARELVESIFDAPVDEPLIAAILERTGGNPFFIEEVVRELRSAGTVTEGGDRVRASSMAADQLPATVQDVLEARLERLPESANRVVQPASVIGRTFWLRLLERVLPGEPLSADLAILEAEMLVTLRELTPEVTYAFRQALIRDVAYHTQLLSTRRELHGAVGRGIEDLYAGRLDEFVDLLAYHYERSDDVASACRWLVRAGDRARRLYARSEALTYYSTALTLAADDPVTRAAAHEGTGDVQRVAGALAEALDAYGKAVADLPLSDRVGHARLRRKVGTVEQLRGETAAALSSFAQALADLPDDAARERALVLMEIGQVRWQQARYDESIETLRQAVAEAERARADDARADAVKHLGTVHVLKGDNDDGLRSYRESLSIYEALGDLLGQANALNNIGVVSRRIGDYPAALDAHAHALTIRERIGDPFGIGTTRNNLAQIHRARGELDAADREYRGALELWTSIGYATGVAIARVGIGITAVERGEHAAGRAQLMTALEEWERLGGRAYLSETQRYVAQSYLEEDLASGLAWAERAVDTARSVAAREQEGIALQVLGTVLLRLGDVAGAVTTLEQSRDLLRQTTERQELARTLATLSDAYAALDPADPRRTKRQALRDEAREMLAGLGAALDLHRLAEAAERAGP